MSQTEESQQQSDCFRSVTSSMMKKRQQHLNKVLSSLNSESLPATMDGDVEMEDVQNSSFGFKKASTGGNDFSFMKRKVRVNAVDKDIKEY